MANVLKDVEGSKALKNWKEKSSLKNVVQPLNKYFKRTNPNKNV